MEEGSRSFGEIQEILKAANLTLEPNLLRSRILELLFRKLYVECSVFFLPDDYTGGIEVNLDRMYVRQYKEYFHQQDPIQLIERSHFLRVIRLEELIDYHAFETSEFYCDFLKPQRIHHKLYINLYAGDRYHGRIALYRPPTAERFSKENVRMLRMLAPFFAFALDHNDLLIKTKLQEGAFNLLDRNMSIGIILVDESMRPVYMNQKAKGFCQAFLGRDPYHDRSARLPPKLLDDCRAISGELRKSGADCLVLPKYRVFRDNQLKSFHISSRILPNGVSKSERLYVISIEEAYERMGLQPGKLKEIYKLTDREIDIVYQTYQGLKNAEIARRLFISEITVKKHIQNIFQKMGVRSRTALIHTILEDSRISLQGPTPGTI